MFTVEGIVQDSKVFKVQICCPNIIERIASSKRKNCRIQVFLPFTDLSQIPSSHLTILCSKFYQAHSMCQTIIRHQDSGSKNTDKVLLENHIKVRGKYTAQVIVTINSCWKRNTEYYRCFCDLVAMSDSCDLMDCNHQAPCSWDSLGKNIGVGCCFQNQTQVSCIAMNSLQTAPRESPYMTLTRILMGIIDRLSKEAACKADPKNLRFTWVKGEIRNRKKRRGNSV